MTTNEQPTATKEWEQQPEEPPKWFAAFVVYHGLGAGRQVKTAHESAQTIKKQSLSRWRKMATQWRWKARAEAWDAYCAQEAVKRVTQAQIDHLSEGGEKLKKAFAKTSGIILDLLERGDVEAIKEHGPMIITVLGRGGAGPFILNGIKTIVGEKITLEGKFDVSKVEFKDPTHEPKP